MKQNFDNITIRQYRFLTSLMTNLVLYEQLVLCLRDSTISEDVWRSLVDSVVDYGLAEIVAKIDLKQGGAKITNITEMDIDTIIEYNNGSTVFDMLQITPLGMDVWMSLSSDVEVLYLHNITMAIHGLALTAFISDVKYKRGYAENVAYYVDEDSTPSEIDMPSAFRGFIDTLDTTGIDEDSE